MWELWLDFITLSETGRSNFATPFLYHLANGLDYEGMPSTKMLEHRKKFLLIYKSRSTDELRISKQINIWNKQKRETYELNCKIKRMWGKNMALLELLQESFKNKSLTRIIEITSAARLTLAVEHNTTMQSQEGGQ